MALPVAGTAPLASHMRTTSSVCSRNLMKAAASAGCVLPAPIAQTQEPWPVRLP